MTSIQLTGAGKRFRFEWILRGITQQFESGQRWAILGPNGSGKSTLLKMLSGHLTPSKGKAVFLENDRPIDAEEVWKLVSYCAPYIELIEEMTLREIFEFHYKMKPFVGGLSANELLKLTGLEKAADKELKFFSSGMKQRAKLAMAICSETPILLIDEPTTNLDVEAVRWYHHLLDQFAGDRLVVVASNEPADVVHCTHQLKVLDYK